MRAVVAWHDAMPAEQRRPFYPGLQIAAGTKLTPFVLGPALRALGWRHAQRRLPERDGLPVNVWAPPGAPNPRRRPGRPSAQAAPIAAHDGGQA